MKLEYININDFELNWRWTQKNHCLIPEEDLIKIKPLSEVSSESIYKQRPVVSGTSQEIDCKETPITFLTKNLGKETVYVSWSKNIAVQTDTSTLIKYFSDICYPSSDDVTIWPLNNSWLMQYNHYETITFTKLTK